MGAGYYTELFSPIYAGRRWIITADTAAGATGLAQRIVGAGAEAMMVILATRVRDPSRLATSRFSWWARPGRRPYRSW